MAVTVSVEEASLDLSRLLDRVSQGEDIIIERAGLPAARLVAIREAWEPRVPGSARGKVVMGPDFDDPLPDETDLEAEYRAMAADAEYEREAFEWIEFTPDECLK